jgi:hypothetical protein
MLKREGTLFYVCESNALFMRWPVGMGKLFCSWCIDW